MAENDVGSSTELVIPTGELVSLDDYPRVAQALKSLRQMEDAIREAKAELTHALVEHSRQLGSKTITFEDGHQAIVRGGTETIYDAEEIEAGLRAAGMGEIRIRQIVKEIVSYKVDARQAMSAAVANPDYAAVIRAHTRVVEKRHSIEVK